MYSFFDRNLDKFTSFGVVFLGFVLGFALGGLGVKLAKGATSYLDVNSEISGKLNVNVDGSLDSTGLHVKNGEAYFDDQSKIAEFTASDGNSYIRFNDSTQSTDIGQDNNSGNPYFYINQNYVTGFPEFVIDSSGNVGIGKSGPDTKLEVSGGNLRLSGQEDPAIDMWDTSGGSPHHTWKIWESKSDFKIGYSSDGSTPSPDLYIGNSNGNVGIGTTNPSTKLEVSGTSTMHAMEIPFRGKIFERGIDFMISANDNLVLQSDSDGSGGGPYECTLDGTNGSWNCAGSKNFVQKISSTTEAVYTSQESAGVWVVYEGTAELKNGEALVDLPYHYTAVTSKVEPRTKVQVTPKSTNTYGLAVTESNTKEFKVEELMDGNHSFSFNYRVVSIREGYEDKKVVRPIEKGKPLESSKPKSKETKEKQ